MNKITIFFIFLFFLHFSCGSTQRKATFRSCKAIPVALGPEDFVISSSKKGKFLYVSSHDRRTWDSAGEIFRYDINSGVITTMIRTGDPSDLFFAPHGIDLLESKDLLYVISHGHQRNDTDQRILIYRIDGIHLRFLSQVRDPEIVNSPNDLSLTPEGNFYVTNDAANRGSPVELIFGLADSTVAYCIPDLTGRFEGECKIVAGNLGVPNGILVDSDVLYLAASTEDSLYRFQRTPDGSLQNKKLLGKFPGPDNLFFARNGEAKALTDHLIIAGHRSFFSFLLHMLMGTNSPSLIIEYDLKMKKNRVLYENDGSEISAASGGLLLENSLYISQVFDNHVLHCFIPPPQ